MGDNEEAHSPIKKDQTEEEPMNEATTPNIFNFATKPPPLPKCSIRGPTGATASTQNDAEGETKRSSDKEKRHHDYKDTMSKKDKEDDFHSAARVGSKLTILKKPGLVINAKDTPSQMSKAAKKRPKRKLLENGSIVPSPKHKYTVIGLLGSGGFGDVYRVQRQEESTHYAMKTEANDLEERLRRLKIEAEVMYDCSKHNNMTNFLPLIDRGQNKEFKFVVMPVVWLSLDKIRTDFLGKQYTENTGRRICIQMLEALRDLHEIGFLHRDLKPANFAPGLLGNERKIIYMLDFGVARKFVDGRGQLIPPRAKVMFMGTLRYAPRAGIRCQEQARRDDLESICYVMNDIFFDSLLPWKGIVDRVQLLQLKDNYMNIRGPLVIDIFRLMPPELEKIVRYCETLKYESIPDYEWLIKEMTTGTDMVTPLDWEHLKEQPKVEKIDRTASNTHVALKNKTQSSQSNSGPLIRSRSFTSFKKRF